MIREELHEKKKSSIIKYINPIIIGTLCITVWEILVNLLYEKLGIGNTILASILLSVIISIVIEWLTKEWQQ